MTHLKLLLATILCYTVAPLTRIHGQTQREFSFPTDPMWWKQWYLYRLDGADINVVPAWRRGFTGKDISIAINDQGISPGLEELRIDKRKSRYEDIININPAHHGSLSAGVAAARSNEYCGVGVAYDATVIDIQVFSRQRGVPSRQKAMGWLQQAADQGLHVSSHSYGFFDGGASLFNLDESETKVLKYLSEKGREGLGVPIVWSSGNGGNNGDSCAYDASVNDPYTIAVGAVDNNLEPLDISEACSATMAVGFSQSPKNNNSYNIISVMGPAPGDCVRSFSSSSVVAPMMAGAIAILLQANAGLTWRDVHHIIARASNTQAGFKPNSFKVNAAGFGVSSQFGFGLIDVDNMVKASLNDWPELPPRQHCELQFETSKNRKLLGEHSASTSCSIRFLEHVLVSVNFNYSGSIFPTRRGCVALNLISPQGTTVLLLSGRPQDIFQSTLKFTVKSVQYWGEEASGEWRAEFFDAGIFGQPFMSYCRDGFGILKDLKITMYGMDNNPFKDTPTNVGLPTSKGSRETVSTAHTTPSFHGLTSSWTPPSLGRTAVLSTRKSSSRITVASTSTSKVNIISMAELIYPRIWYVLLAVWVSWRD